MQLQPDTCGSRAAAASDSKNSKPALACACCFMHRNARLTHLRVLHNSLSKPIVNMSYLEISDVAFAMCTMSGVTLGGLLTGECQGVWHSPLQDLCCFSPSLLITMAHRPLTLPSHDERSPSAFPFLPKLNTSFDLVDTTIIHTLWLAI